VGSKIQILHTVGFSEAVSRECNRIFMKQLRLAICQDEDFPAVGLIDLFDFDQKTIGQGGYQYRDMIIEKKILVLKH
jgi:hypothetical protein